MPRISFPEYCYNETVAKGLDPVSLDLEQAKLDYEQKHPVLKSCVFVDDQRIPTQRLEGFENWTVCRSWAEWVEYLLFKGPPDHVTFDHDLALEHLEDFRKYEYEGIEAINYGGFTQHTGLQCAQYYCLFCEENKLEMKGVAAHCTERQLGARNIQQCLNNYKKSKGLEPTCFIAAVPTTTLEALALKESVVN